LIFFSAQEATK
jgi:hypothetical protein